MQWRNYRLNSQQKDGGNKRNVVASSSFSCFSSPACSETVWYSCLTGQKHDSWRRFNKSCPTERFPAHSLIHHVLWFHLVPADSVRKAESFLFDLPGDSKVTNKKNCAVKELDFYVQGESFNLRWVIDLFLPLQGYKLQAKEVWKFFVSIFKLKSDDNICFHPFSVFHSKLNTLFSCLGNESASSSPHPYFPECHWSFNRNGCCSFLRQPKRDLLLTTQPREVAPPLMSSL